jgi:hypothetical protein
VIRPELSIDDLRSVLFTVSEKTGTAVTESYRVDPAI